MRNFFVKLFAFFLAVAIGFGAYIMWQRIDSSRRVHATAQTDLQEAERLREEKAKETENNRERYVRLSDSKDTEAIEREARTQGFKKPGEVIYQTQKEDEGTTTAPPLQ